MKHIPVLLSEVIAALPSDPNASYIDATLGDGGHAFALLEQSPNSRLLGIDQDPEQIAIARERLQSFGSRVTFVQSSFSSLAACAKEQGFEAVDGILFDLGYSSRQLSNPELGLNFADDTPLDMRLSPDRTETAADLLNRANEVTIANILYRYGDRHNSRQLARLILTYRRKHPFQVAHDVKTALNLWRPDALAPIFQALRIWVNREYDELEAALPQAVDLLKPGGVLAVITFHSGEDRIVKHFLKQHELLRVEKRIIRPTYDEMKQNSRSRSATLRVATMV